MSNYTQLSNDQICEILRTNTNDQAENLLGANTSRVAKLRRELQVPSPGIAKPFRPLVETRLKFDLSNHETADILRQNKNRQAADALGVSYSMISYLRKKFGIPSPHDQAETARIFTLNHRFFQIIDTEEKAYILGFIAADGNVNPDLYGCEIRICLHPQDEELLVKINTAFESTYPIRTHYMTEKSGFAGTNREQKKLSVRSTLMGADLAQWHIIRAKTETVCFPDIPRHLHRHYLRGLLDGDGYITNEQFGWCGNVHMTNDVQGVGILHGFGELRKYHVKGPSYVTRGGPKNHEMIKWLYEDATIFMDRKKEKFDLFWKDRVYVAKLRTYPISTKHIPCALESLPSYLRQDSMT